MLLSIGGATVSIMCLIFREEMGGGDERGYNGVTVVGIEARAFDAALVCGKGEYRYGLGGEQVRVLRGADFAEGWERWRIVLDLCELQYLCGW